MDPYDIQHICAVVRRYMYHDCVTLRAYKQQSDGKHVFSVILKYIVLRHLREYKRQILLCIGINF